MKHLTDYIKNPKQRAYIEAVADGKAPRVTLSADELEEAANGFIDGMDKTLAEADELIARHKMGDIPEAISLSYIAKTYFGKSRGWLMQKVNGNTVNGRKAAFTPGESRQMREALLDLSEKLSKAALAF
jgi:hypothetical protein